MRSFSKASNLTGLITTFTVPVLAMRRPTQGRLVISAAALLATSACS
ncbi:MAG: hypothetical protein WAV54_11360 [Acidimicrobiales bacterium]